MHTDKPINLPIRDYIIRRISSKLRTSEDIISSVISHQFSTGNAATKTFHQVEFSGLGKFMFSEKKGLKKLEKYNNIKPYFDRYISEGIRTDHYTKKLTDLTECINYIKTKLQDVQN